MSADFSLKNVPYYALHKLDMLVNEMLMILGVILLLHCYTMNEVLSLLATSHKQKVLSLCCTISLNKIIWETYFWNNPHTYVNKFINNIFMEHISVKNIIINQKHNIQKIQYKHYFKQDNYLKHKRPETPKTKFHQEIQFYMNASWYLILLDHCICLIIICCWGCI